MKDNFKLNINYFKYEIINKIKINNHIHNFQVEVFSLNLNP